VIVDCAVYEAGKRRAGELPLEDAYEAARERDAFVWIGLFEPTEAEFESVQREFDLHELAVEDAIKAHQRPKLEVYGDSLFVVLKTVRWVGEPDHVQFGEILVFAGDDFLITVRHGDETELHDVRLALEKRPELLRNGPGAALHSIVDHVVDDYEPVIEQLDAEVRETEEDVFSPSRSNPAARIYGLKRAVLMLHGAIVPLLDPLAGLAGGRHPLIHQDMHSYFRDVYDHLTRMAAHIISLRELLTNVLTANLTQASIRQNDDVRKISAWAAIIAVPTLITGIYGMNFEHMPELTWRVGYPLAVLFMIFVSGTLYRFFHKAGWL
jgi:magnesium transporter